MTEGDSWTPVVAGPKEMSSILNVEPVWASEEEEGGMIKISTQAESGAADGLMGTLN